jgi:glycine oxidase
MHGEGDQVIIAGGGAIGCATAFYLAREGLDVRVLERDAIGSQASGVALGLLSPLLGMGSAGPFLELGLQGLRLIKELVPHLEASTGTSIGYAEAPLLLLAFTAEEERQDKEDMEWRKTLSPGVAWLERQDVLAREKAVNPRVRGAALLEGQVQVESYRLVLAFARAAEMSGASISSGEVVGIERQGDRITAAVLASGRKVQGDIFVLAVGAWSRGMASRLGANAPVEPERGQIITLEGMSNAPVHTLYRGNSYVMPRAAGTIQAGTTREQVGFDSRPTERGRFSILRRALHLCPDLGAARVVQAAAGLRPVSQDGLPLIGRLPGYDNAYIATGHGRKGILLSAITGQAMARLIVHGETSPLITPFDPARFTRR